MKKEYYTLNEHKLLILKIKSKGIILDLKTTKHYIRILSYFGDKKNLIILLDFVKKEYLDFYKNKNFLLEVGRTYKTFGEYEIALKYYIALFELDITDSEIPYLLTILSKFHSDYFQRIGLNKSLIKISYQRAINMKKEILERNQGEFRVIIDSYLKIAPPKERNKIIKTHLSKKPIITNRVKFHLLEFDLEHFHIDDKRYNELLKDYYRLLQIQRKNKNFKSYGERLIKLASILRKKQFEQTGDLKVTEITKSLESKLKEIYDNSKYFNDSKLKTGAAKEFLFSRLKKGDFTVAYEYYQIIRKELWLKDQNIFLSHYLLEVIEVLLHYSIKARPDYANIFAKDYLEINNILFNQLLLDEDIFNNNSNNVQYNDSSKLFIKLRNKLDDNEIDIVNGYFKEDYKALSRNLIDAINIISKINYVSIVFEQTKLFNYFIKFDSHDFRGELNNITKETKKLKSEFGDDDKIINQFDFRINESIKNLNELIDGWQSQKTVLEIEEINLFNTINETISKNLYYKSYNININIINKVNKSTIINFNKYLFQKIIFNIIKNIYDHSAVINVTLIFTDESNEEIHYLIVKDNIGDYDKFKKIINELNSSDNNKITSSKSIVGGKGLVSIKQTLSYFLKNEIKLILTKDSNGFKKLLIPVKILEI